MGNDSLRCACLVAVAVHLAAGCSPSSAPRDADVTAVDATDVVSTDIPAAAPTLIARFVVPSDGSRPTPLAIPFPSDIYLDTDGTLVDNLSDFSALHLHRGTDALAAAFRDLDGFSRTAGAVFLVDGAGSDASGNTPSLDPASLPGTASASMQPDASAFIIDLDPSTPADRARIPAVAGWHVLYHSVVVQPDATVLRPGRRYAFVLTTHARSTSPGLNVTPSPDFIAIRDAMGTARTTPLGTLYGTAIDTVVQRAGSGFDRSTIAAVSVFSTQTRHRQLRTAADAVRAGHVGPAPTLSTDPAVSSPLTVARFGSIAHTGWTATLDEWLGMPRRTAGQDLPGFPDLEGEGTSYGLAHDAIGAVFTGNFDAPDYRDAANGEIHFNADGSPVPVRIDQRLSVTFALPRGPAPATGFPVVIWGHGLSNHRRHMFSVANQLARQGIATVAIDFATFGTRFDPTDVTTLEPGTYHGPDGIGDLNEYPPDAFFGHITSLVAFRDNMRQTVLDLVQLRRLLGETTLDLSFIAAEYGGIAPTIDRNHVGYAGDSLGGLMGTIYSSVSPETNPVLLNVPGGGIFTTIAPDAPVLAGYVGIVPSVAFGAPTGDDADRFHPVMQIAQIGIDAADPSSFARIVTEPEDGSRGHDVWMVESLWDEVMSNRSTELLAREMGLTQMLPAASMVAGFPSAPGPLHANLAMGATGGYFQQVPSTHGGNIASRSQVRNYTPPFPRTDGTRFVPLAHPYRIREPIVAYQQRIGEFFTSAFAGNAQITVNGIEPLLDLDDDGWTDDEEHAAGTDPFDPNVHPAGSPPHVRDVGF